jgi:hypothetical protein
MVAGRPGGGGVSALPRGICPVCESDVALRVNGTLREHRDARAATYGVPGAVREGMVPVCPGSGEEPA